MELRRSCCDGTRPQKCSNSRRQYILPREHLLAKYKHDGNLVDICRRKRTFLVESLPVFPKDDSFLGAGDCTYHAMSHNKHRQLSQSLHQIDNSHVKWSSKQSSLNSRHGEDGVFNNSKNKTSAQRSTSTTDQCNIELRNRDICGVITEYNTLPTFTRSDSSIPPPLSPGAVIAKGVHERKYKEFKAASASSLVSTQNVHLKTCKSSTDFDADHEHQQSQSTIQKLQAQIADVQNSYKRSISRDTVQNALQKLEGRAKDARSDYRSIFQSAFNNLEDHVTEVQNNCRNKWRRGKGQKHQSRTSVVQVSDSISMPSLLPRSDSDILSHPDNLCTSLQVFQIQKWRPLTPNHKPQSPPTHGSAYERTRSTVGTSSLSLQQRRVSEPQNKCSLDEFPGSLTPFLRRQDAQAERNFDIVSSRIFSRDLRPMTAKSTYDDVTEQTFANDVFTEECEERTKAVNGDLSSTSGIDSEGGNSLADEEFFGVCDELDNDSISEFEDGKESISELSIRSPNLHHGPEIFHPVVTKQSELDLTSLDFPDDSPEEPLYEFQSPLPPPFDKINLYQLAKEKSDWGRRNGNMAPVDSTICAMIDRLLELEKRQIETVDWEERRFRVVRKRPVSRSNKTRETCVQATCQADDTSASDRSNQPPCIDTSKDTRSEQRMRQPNEDIKFIVHPRIAVAQVKNLYQKRLGIRCAATNQLLLARPKSAFCSFGRGKNHFTSRDIRPISASSNVLESLHKDIHDLRVESTQPASPSKVKQHQPTNKGSKLPSKNYFSSNNSAQVDVFPTRLNSAKTKIRATQKPNLI